MRWSRRPVMPRTIVRGRIGKMRLRDACCHTPSSASAPATFGTRAMNAAFSAPTDVPTRSSGCTPWANSAWSMPAWVAPSAPPPVSTNARKVRSLPRLEHDDRDLAIGARLVHGVLTLVHLIGLRPCLLALGAGGDVRPHGE